jgi:hypothetical protein
MTETVRIVSDGEEMVLSHGDVYRIALNTEAGDVAIERRREVTEPKPVAIRYMGFQDVDGRREYELSARRGEQTGRYVLSIEWSAFSKRHALLQDGPDICYQKLRRELEGVELQGSDGIAVTDAELAAYREAHTMPARRRSPASSRGPEPAKAS